MATVAKLSPATYDVLDQLAATVIRGIAVDRVQKATGKQDKAHNGARR